MAIKHKTSILSSAKRIVYTHLVGSLNTAGVLQYPVAVITQPMFLCCSVARLSGKLYSYVLWRGQIARIPRESILPSVTVALFLFSFSWKLHKFPSHSSGEMHSPVSALVASWVSPLRRSLLKFMNEDGFVDDPFGGGTPAHTLHLVSLSVKNRKTGLHE